MEKTKSKRKSNLPPGPGPGRPKGLKNKVPTDLKEKILAISEQLEKQNKGLADLAEKKPDWFFENFVKPMVPKNVDMKHNLTGPTIELVRQILSEKKSK